MTPEGSWFCISACSNAIRHHLAGTPSAALCWVIEPVGTLELQGLWALTALSCCRTQLSNPKTQQCSTGKPSNPPQQGKPSAEIHSISAAIIIQQRLSLFRGLHNSSIQIQQVPLFPTLSQQRCHRQSMWNDQQHIYKELIIAKISDRSTINFICLSSEKSTVCMRLCVYIYIYTSPWRISEKVKNRIGKKILAALNASTGISLTFFSW